MTDSITWSFTGSSFSPTAATGGLTGSAMTAGSGLASLNIQAALGYSTDPVLQATMPTTATTTIAASVTNHDYFTFTVTVPAGGSFTPATITGNGARGGASTTRQFQFGDGASGLYDVPIVQNTQRPTWQAFSANISAIGAVAGGTVLTFKCYVSGPLSTNQEFDDITLTGTFSTSAFSASPALSGVGSLSVVAKPVLTALAGLSGVGSLGGTSGFSAAAALSGSGTLAASGVANIPTPPPPVGNGSARAFDLRLVAYTPLGARIGPIPDLGITFGSVGGSASTLQAKVSTAVYGALPGPELEVAVEYWRNSTTSWKEGRDSRFAVTLHELDDRDLSGIVDLTGINIMAFLLSAMALAGATPYTQTNVRSEAAATNAAVSVSGTTFTWPTHVFGSGDLVRVTSKGNATGITSSSVYFVRNPTTNTFQISATPNGAIKSCGTASNVGMARVVTRVVFIGGSHSFVKSDAVSLTGGTAIGLNDNTVYYVVNPTAATVQLSDKPGGVPVEMSTANTTFTNIYRNLDGQRVFTNCTPGTVMTAAYLEARDGVGRGVGTGTLHGFTVSTDSAGAAWTSLTNDPTTPGIGLGFQPGTPGSQMLQALLDNGYAEWYQSGTSGRTFHLVNPLTGNDHTLDAQPMRIGTTASSVKKTIDYSAFRTAVTMRGVGNVIKTVSGATTGWGRLEMYETAAGATSNTMATQLATKEIASHTPQVAYTVTEVAEEAAFLPLENYSRGDWVACQVGGTLVWTKLRCEGWQFTKNGAGQITVTTNLAAVKKSLVAKMAKKTSGMTAGISTGGTGQPLLESDNRKPAAPSSVTCTSVPFFNTDDSAEALINVTWPTVALDIGGTDVQVTDYEVWVRPEGALTGAAIGHVHGLVCDVGPYACGKTFGITVRAKSITGEWGEFSAEVECTTSFPVTIPAPPTAPTLTSSLGSVRVAWDGNLIDPGSGTGAPPAGFAYVYAEVSPNGSTGWAVCGQNLGHAGYTVVGGLTKGSTYFFRLTGINSIGTAGTASSTSSIAIVGVVGPDLVANTLTANEIATGSITADELDLGTVPTTGPVERVPMPLSNVTFWAAAIAGGANIGVSAVGSNATALTTGIQLVSSSSSGQAVAFVTAELVAPPSRQVYVSGVTPSSNAHFVVREWNGVVFTYTTLAILPAGITQTLATDTRTYSVYLEIFHVVATVVVPSAHVMEAIGTDVNGGQAAILTPAGLRLYDDSAHLALDLSTASKQFLKVYDQSGPNSLVVASIDESGNADFAEVSGSGFDLNGLIFTNETDTDTLSQAQPNNASFGSTPLLDRLGRGVIYDCTWDTLNGTVVTTQYLRIAQDKFTLEDGRTYLFVLHNAGLMISTANASGVNVYVELELNTVANTSPSSGTVVQRAVVFNAEKGYYSLPPVVYTAATSVATIDTVNRLIPAGVPLYWQVNTNLSATPTASYAFAEFGNSRGLSVIDIGSSFLTRPVSGADTLPNTTDRTTSGASSGTTSGGTTGTSTTTTFTAAWSRSWHDSGSTIVSGTGQYTNGAAMYQGNGVTPMGAKFGFNALGISGKTVTAMSLYMHADYFAYSGKRALLGTHGDSAAPATYTGARANSWSHSWSGGQGQWVSVPSSLWAGFAAGTYRGFTLGVDGSDSNYAYFEGATMSLPPKIKVTYH